MIRYLLPPTKTAARSSPLIISPCSPWPAFFSVCFVSVDDCIRHFFPSMCRCLLFWHLLNQVPHYFNRPLFDRPLFVLFFFFSVLARLSSFPSLFQSDFFPQMHIQRLFPFSSPARQRTCQSRNPPQLEERFSFCRVAFRAATECFFFRRLPPTTALRGQTFFLAQNPRSLQRATVRPPILAGPARPDANILLMRSIPVLSRGRTRLFPLPIRQSKSPGRDDPCGVTSGPFFLFSTFAGKSPPPILKGGVPLPPPGSRSSPKHRVLRWPPRTPLSPRRIPLFMVLSFPFSYALAVATPVGSFAAKARTSPGDPCFFIFFFSGGESLFMRPELFPRRSRNIPPSSTTRRQIFLARTSWRCLAALRGRSTFMRKYPPFFSAGPRQDLRSSFLERG